MSQVSCSVRVKRGRFLGAVKPQVSFASLSSPAVMDIRRLRRRLLEQEEGEHKQSVQIFHIFALRAFFLTLIFINDPLIIINTRFAQKKLMFHTPRSA